MERGTHWVKQLPPLFVLWNCCISTQLYCLKNWQHSFDWKVVKKTNKKNGHYFWRGVYVEVNYASVGLDDGLSPACDEPLSGPIVIWNRLDAIEHILMVFLFGIQNWFVCEMSIPLSWPQCVKTSIVYLEDRRQSAIHSVPMGRYNISNQDNIMFLRLSSTMGLLVNYV